MSRSPAERLKASEDYVRAELRIMGQVEDEAIIKRVGANVAQIMEQMRDEHDAACNAAAGGADP